MWITKDVDLPESLIDAQRDERLVVFVGAGVSVGPPSNLPDFKRLATKVGGGVLAHEDSEPVDRFLGRLEKQGIQVHSRTCRIIDDPNSKPTPLHRILLSLFESPGTVRIVTTNFDRHFSTVAAELFQDEVEVYHAPALPLGGRFNGLVYLHGSVAKGSESLVLTDSDFGQAYLTDGWATRFLCEMFTRYTVIFVGYRHGDPIIGYIARALLPETSRFALTQEGHVDHWKFFGIVPVTYPLSNDTNKHSALDKGLAAWADLSKMGALDHERRIREIVKSTPSLEKETDDYIEGVLKNLVTVRFFTRHARTPEWLRWADDKQAFRKLFQIDESVDEIAREMAAWFAKNFVCEHPDEALALMQRRWQKLNPVLQNEISHRLTFAKPRPNPQILARWVTFLLSSRLSDWRLYSLEHLLSSCRYPVDKHTLVLLFEYLTRPHLKLKPHFALSAEDSSQAQQVDVEIVVGGDEHLLKRTWTTLFQPNLGDLTQQLEPILTNHLTQAHFLLRAIGKATEHRDYVSLLRSAIEPHEQDRYGDHLDILIDAARDLIESMLRYGPDRAHALIETWSTSDVPVLKRLAVHGITESLQMDPNKKIAWLLEKNWLYNSGPKHEVFRLLAETYPKAIRSCRVHLLECIDRGPVGETTKDLEERTRKYKVCNLLVWLHGVAPDCPLVTKHLAAIEKVHPDFRPHKHPDFDFWTSVGFEKSQSPLTVEELLSEDLNKEIGWLLTYKEDQFVGRSREGLLNKIAEAAAQSFRWSSKLAEVLQKKSEWSSDIWGSVFSGWQKGSLKENEWKEALALLQHHLQLHSFAHSAVDLLEHGVSKEHGGITLSCLFLAEKLAGQLFDACVENLRDEKEVVDRDWLFEAINHPGGKITEFWLRAVSKRWKQAGENWTGLLPKYKKYFRKVLSGKSYTAQMGRVILASQIRFLFALDAEWTGKYVLPLLDWSIDERRAQQAWHSHLMRGGWHEALLPKLLPLYEQTFSKLSCELSSMRKFFCGHLASIALFSSSNPMQNGWLSKFLLKADPESHKSFASEVTNQLISAKEESVKDLWSRWIDVYWAQRVTGVPLPLSQDEKEEMVLWALALEPVFPAVVERICATPAPPLQQTRLYYELVEKDFAEKHPKALTRLLQHLLANADESFLHCTEVEQLVRGLVDSGAPAADILVVCEHLAQLGCPKASELRDLLDGSP